jgi:CheY-like chemotaxis protein
MKRRILLADDSVTIQKVIELTFMDEDYEVRAVSNGDDAIAALLEVDPDFVIADVHMPGANGYEVCRRAKAMREGLPVLLLVGTFEPFDEGQARAAGADSFLKKPFDSQELLQRVDELLSHAPSKSPATRVTDLPLTASDPMAQAAGAAPAEPWPEWPEVQAEPEPESVLSMPPLEPFEDLRPTPAAPSPFLEEDSPFVLEEDRSALASAAPETALPADEPLFDLDSPQLSLGEPVPAVSPGPAGFATTPEERLGIPQGAAPLVGSLAETEARIEAPAPPSISAAHEPEASWTAPPISPISPAPPPPPQAAPLPVGSITPAASTNGGGLSDADVDRIARRVVELLGDKAIRDVAWEVIPDLAEVVIRDRLRELESQVEDL